MDEQENGGGVTSAGICGANEGDLSG